MAETQQEGVFRQIHLGCFLTCQVKKKDLKTNEEVIASIWN